MMWATKLSLLLIVASALRASTGALLSNGCASAPSRWMAVASSADGNVLTATDGLVVYRSINAGLTWTVAASVNGPVGGGWRALACDATGNKLYGSTGARIHLSLNGGATWNLGFTWHEADVWPTLSVSADGVTVLAGTSFDNVAAGKVYRSKGSGKEGTWSEVTPWPPGTTTPWAAAAISSDGTTAAVGTFNRGAMYVATGQAYWVARRPDGTNDNSWTAVALSASGSSIVAAAINGQGFAFSSKLFYSTNSGASWAPTQTALPYPSSYPSIAAASDGKRFVMASWMSFDRLYTTRGTLYTTADAGATWQAVGEDKGWYSVASSSDGKNLVAAPYKGGVLHTSTDFGATWVACGSATLGGRRRLRSVL